MSTMYVMPRTGWWALVLLGPVLLYPLHWSAFLVLPGAVRATGAVVVGLGVLIAASLVVASVAIFGLKERSLVQIVVAADLTVTHAPL